MKAPTARKNKKLERMEKLKSAREVGPIIITKEEKKKKRNEHMSTDKKRMTNYKSMQNLGYLTGRKSNPGLPRDRRRY